MKPLRYILDVLQMTGFILGSMAATSLLAFGGFILITACLVPYLIVISERRRRGLPVDNWWS